MKNLELTDTEAVALINALKYVTVTDRYPLSPRVRTLVRILNKLRPEPTQPAASSEPRGLCAAVRRVGMVGGDETLPRPSDDGDLQHDGAEAQGRP